MKDLAADQEPGLTRIGPRSGQTVLQATTSFMLPAEQVRDLRRLSDPALSELGLDELLDELLVRVRDALLVDTVAILLLDPQSQQLVARAAKGIEEEVEQGVRIPIGSGFAGRIAAERVPIFIADVDHADILNPILRQKRIRSLLGVPLIVEGSLIGVMHVGSLRPRTFGQDELAVLYLAAARVGPGIERARLTSALEREHRVAMVLQRSLLPRQLGEHFGVAVAARYFPARDEVGGDWFDVIELPRGQVGIAIGDVVGHGVRAAALMGQLRTALHSYAIEGHTPGETLERVDRFVETLREPTMATAAYAVFDAECNVLRFASAGHLPPIVISGGEAHQIEIRADSPLGAGGFKRFAERELSLGDGDTLVLYTDGLVERRGLPLSRGIAELLEVARWATTAEEACLLAVEGLVPDAGLRDDGAIVALQNVGVPADLRICLPADPKVLTRVRQIVRRWLLERGAGTDELCEVTLAVNEACANAIEHAYAPGLAIFELEAHACEDEVTMLVRDTGRWRQPRGRDRGRGLRIIESAMQHVEIKHGEMGTEIVMRRRLARR